MDEEPVRAMDGLLERLVAVLSGSAGVDATGARTTGVAADGMVRAEVRPGGRVDSIALDPKLLRTPGQIAPGIVAAVNEALAAGPEPASTAGSRIPELQAIQHDSLALTQQMNASLLATLERLKPR